MYKQCLVALSAFGLALGLSLSPRGAWTDPAYSVPTSTLDAAQYCPNGVKGRAGGIVFLVHGTGATAEDTWQEGPYNLILPGLGPGYDICWVQLPGKALGNAATAAEYVTYGIKKYASQSKTGKVFVIGHSQGGGLSIPWALDFFPSTQQDVAGFIALSGDFNGTLLGNPVCIVEDVSEMHCAESIWQQAEGSQFLRAEAIDAGHAIVGTTSIYTLEDEIIPPEPYSSTLAGASDILIQTACGPLHVADHFLAPFDSGYFGLALDALAHGGVASVGRFDKSYCSGFKGNNAVNSQLLGSYLKESFDDVVSVVTDPAPYVSTSEPPVPEYVCKRYPSSGFKCAPGPLN